MQYGKYLKTHIIQKWEQYYVNYNLLKRSIRNKNHEEFWEHIKNELIKVNLFYNHFITQNTEDSNQHSKNLNQYIILNYMAIFKAIKKYDKKLCKSSKIYFFELIQKQPFYNNYLKQQREIKPTRLVIFDKDGTLIQLKSCFIDWFKHLTNNMNDYIKNKNNFYKHLGFNENENNFDGNSIIAKGTNDDLRKKILEFIKSEHPNTSEENICRFINNKWIYINITDKNIIPCGNIHKVFNFLKNNNIKIAICTSDDKYPTLQTLKILKLNNMIDYLVCGDDPISSKPSPEPLWKICEKLNINPNETIMIGDTISDIHAGLNAKCSKVLGVLTGGYKKNELHNADFILSSIDELPEYISNNSNIINNCNLCLYN